MSGGLEPVVDDVEYSDYTYDEVLEAAAVFTLSPSNPRWVDVRGYLQRNDDADPRRSYACADGHEWEIRNASDGVPICTTCKREMLETQFGLDHELALLRKR